jgi:hypothetical protein
MNIGIRSGKYSYKDYDVIEARECKWDLLFHQKIKEWALMLSLRIHSEEPLILRKIREAAEEGLSNSSSEWSWLWYFNN